MQVAKLIEDGKEVIEDGKEVIVERKELIEDLFEKAEEYVQTNIQLAKLKATDKGAEIVSSLVSKMAIVVLVFFFILMLNIGIAFWISDAIGKTHYGFLVVGGFYALISLILYIFRDHIIKAPISNSIIEQVLKDKNHE